MSKRILITVLTLAALAVAGGLMINSFRKNKPAAEQPVSTSSNEPAQSAENQTSAVETVDPKDWLTYTNEGWGYQIKYPPNLFIKSNPQGDKFPNDPSSPSLGGQTLIISDQEKMGTQDVMPNEKIHFEINTFSINHPFNQDKTMGEYITNNENITKVKINPGKPIEAFEEGLSFVYVIKNGWVYHLHGINYVDPNRETANYKLIRQIIETFEFTK